MQTIQEITPFEVPAGKDEEFLKAWNHVAERVQHASGVLSIHLHESLDPDTKFRFVSIIQWESSMLFEAARSQASQAFEEMRRLVPFAAYSAGYRLLVAAVATPPRASNPPVTKVV